MCEKCERTADHLAKGVLPAWRKQLGEAWRAGGLGDGPNPETMLLLLVRMAKLQAEEMGLTPGPVLLRAGASILAGVPFDMTALSADTVTIERADLSTTTH